MSKVVLEARSRESKGSVEARKIRRAGRVPGVLYGRSGKAISLDLDAVDLSHSLKTITESTIVKVDLGGKSYDAFVKDTQRNILDGKILHVDFYEVESGVLLRAKVAVHLNGNPVGVREGGVLESPVHDVEVECLPSDLPERIIVDVSTLGMNQSIHVRDLPLSDSIRILSNPDMVVALVKVTREIADDTAEKGTEEASAAAGA